MKHPALRELYDLVPEFKHKELDGWVRDWVDVAYSTSSIHIPADVAPDLITSEVKRTRAAVATAAVEAACKSTWEFSKPIPSKDMLVTSKCYFLMPERKK